MSLNCPHAPMKPERKVTSFRLSTLATRQLAELTAKLEMNNSEIVSTAIDRMYQQEIDTMTSQTNTLTIHSIDTKPEHDPYTNISGIVSRTYLKLDPRDNTVWVTQEYNDNSTPSDEWHGLVLTWIVPGHPTEDAMREWINDNMDRLAAICAGYESMWNGSNHIGRLTDEAAAIKQAIEFDFDHDAGPSDYYVYWTVEEWTDKDYYAITAATTDDELHALAANAIAALDKDQILNTDEDGVYEHFKARRDELKAEADEE